MSDISDKDYENLKAAKGLHVVDIWAPWCGPCKRLTPIIDEIAKEEMGVNVHKLNADDNPNTCMELGVRGIPTVVFLKDGKVVETLVGFQSKDKLLEVIDKHR